MVRRRFLLLAPLAIAACANVLGFQDIDPPTNDSDGGLVDGATPDASAPSDGAVDSGSDGASVIPTGPKCDLHAPFTSFERLASLHTTGELHPTLSQDELEVFFHRTSDSDNLDHIYRSTRADRDASFTSVLDSVRAIDTWATTAGLTNLAEPSLSGDGKRLYFQADDVNDVAGIYVAVRATPANDFTAFYRVELPTPALGDVAPFIMADDRVLLYSDNGQLSRASLFGEVAATQITKLVTGKGGQASVLSNDGTVLYFNGGAGPTMFVADVDIVAGTVTNVAPVPTLDGGLNDDQNAPATEEPGFLSPDNCRLYYHRSDGSGVLYVATRQPPP